jgi:hypothetical protein
MGVSLTLQEKAMSDLIIREIEHVEEMTDEDVRMVSGGRDGYIFSDELLGRLSPEALKHRRKREAWEGYQWYGW